MSFTADCGVNIPPRFEGSVRRASLNFTRCARVTLRTGKSWPSQARLLNLCNDTFQANSDLAVGDVSAMRLASARDSSGLSVVPCGGALKYALNCARRGGASGLRCSVFNPRAGYWRVSSSSSGSSASSFVSRYASKASRCSSSRPAVRRASDDGSGTVEPRRAAFSIASTRALTIRQRSLASSGSRVLRLMSNSLRPPIPARHAFGIALRRYRKPFLRRSIVGKSIA